MTGGWEKTLEPVHHGIAPKENNTNKYVCYGNQLFYLRKDGNNAVVKLVMQLPKIIRYILF